MFGSSEGPPRRGAGQRAGVGSPVTYSGSLSVPKLQKELKEMKVKHKEETYWLKLELDTMKREKEAVEQRMSELYRDMQELKDPTIADSIPDDDDLDAQLQAKVKKYSSMVKALNNQIILIRHSSEQIFKNLKDEIKDVVDASSQTERDLLTELEKLQQENETLKTKLQSGNGSSGSDMLKAEIQELKKEKAELAEELKAERTKSRDTISHLRQEKTRLSEMLERMQGDVLVLRSSADSAQSMEQIREDRDESLQTLERVAVLWDRADEAIHSLETVIEELKPKEEQPVPNEDRERALSTLETASLVHGQVKVALMLIELKLRNGLMSLKNDAAALGSMAASDPAIASHIAAAQEESMTAISKVEESLKLQMEHLEDKSLAETKEVKENLESRMKDLKEMQTRQKQLEQEVAKMSVDELGTLAKETSASSDKSVELFVSRKILERLQNEVLQVVARVKEKNETIGRLEASVEEHKAREKTLIEEVRRLMKNRADGDADNAQISLGGSHGEFEEEELLEEIVEEESEVVEEEIIEEEDEEFVEEEVLETSSLS